MAKETKKDEAAEVVGGNAPAVIEVETGKEMSVADVFAQMEAAEIGLELGSDYFKLEGGESERVIFVEMTEINKINSTDGEMVEAVKLLTKNGRYAINADKVIVSTCRALAAKGRNNVPLQITCKGEVKGKSGFKYKEFAINELIMK